MSLDSLKEGSVTGGPLEIVPKTDFYASDLKQCFQEKPERE